jgi:hypothetical protein
MLTMGAIAYLLHATLGVAKLKAELTFFNVVCHLCFTMGSL